MRLRLLVAAVALLSASLAAHADTLVLDSVVGDTYTYGLFVSANSSEDFTSGQTITLTGLSDVTGVAAAFNGYPLIGSFTSDSVTLTAPASGANFPSSGSLSYEHTDIFSLTSTATTEGPVNFALNGSSSVTGTVDGPVAPTPAVTPEPSSFVLLGTGLLGIAVALRKRFA